MNELSKPKLHWQQRSWTWLLQKVLLPAGDIAFGQKMQRRLDFLEVAQWWDRERIIAYRNEQLQKLIRISYQEVPFYRELLDQHGVKPQEIRCAADLQRIPIIQKAMLREGYPDRTTRATGLKTFEWATSGSTGLNLRVRLDCETTGWFRASFMLALRWAGWAEGEPHLQTGMTLKRNLERKLKDALMGCRYVSAFDLTDEHLDHALDLMERHRIYHLWGYPGSLYCIARRARERGWNVPLRSVVTWGDTLYPQYRQVLQETFGTFVTDTYGCSEGMHIAAQCGTGTHYHLHALDVIVEYLDEAGDPVPPRTPGSLVITRLHPGPMPLIRYRIGDVGMSGGDRICGCGRGYEVMERIEGRDTDIIVTPSGNRLIVHFFTGLIEHFHDVDTFQVVQETTDTMVVRLVPRQQFDPSTPERIVQTLKQHGAADMQIETELVDEIPVSPSGKRRFVFSKVARTASEAPVSAER
ncbi:MAG: phenylacetate--CoA ligase family protein [Armatimonadota bacterium]